MNTKALKTNWKNYLPELLIIVMAFVFYGNTINNGYSLDDIYVVENNPQVEQGFGGLGEIFTSFYANLNGDDGKKMQYGYRPIVKALYAIEYQVFGDNPHAFHFMNVLWYALTVLVVFQVLRQLMRNVDSRLIFLGVMLWLAHPIHTEVVASLKNRDEMLVVLFGFLSLGSFIRYYDKQKILYLISAMLYFLLAYFSKASAMVFLAVIPLSLYFFRDLSAKKLLLVSGAIVLVALIAFYMPKLILEKQYRPVVFYENPIAGRSNFFTRFAPAMGVLFFYVKMLFLPYPMSFYYGYDAMPIADFGDWQVYAGIIIHFGLFIYAIKNIKKKSLASWIILFYLITISIYANWVKAVMGIVADRFLFLPSLGFALAIAAVLWKVAKVDEHVLADKRSKMKKWSKLPSWVYGIVGVLMLVSLIYTVDRNKDWEDHISIMKADIDHLEHSAKANHLYANAVRHEMVANPNAPARKIQNDIKLIEKHYTRAVDIYPEYFEAWNQLGELNMLMKKNYSQAEKCFKQSIESNANFKTPYANLGYLYDLKKDYKQSADYYEKSLEIDDSEVRTISNLVYVLLKMNEFDKAQEWNNRIAEKKPDVDLAYYNRSRIYMVAGDTLSAIQNLEKVIEINPKNKNAAIRLMKYYEAKNDKEKAAMYRQKAVEASKK